MLRSAFVDGAFVDSPSGSSSESSSASPYVNRHRHHDANYDTSHHTHFSLTADRTGHNGGSSPELRFKKGPSFYRGVPPSGSMRRMSTANGHHQDDVTTLRHQVADLEMALAKTEARIEDTKVIERDMESTQLALSVAQRNADIQKANVDTLKGLCVQLASQLEEARIQIRTAEEKLASKGLREELAAAATVDEVRREYEGRMDALRKKLQSSTEALNTSTARWQEREVAQDERLRRLEAEKDDTILKLLRENAMLKKVLETDLSRPRGQESADRRPQTEGAKERGGNQKGPWASGIVSTPHRRVAPVPPTIEIAKRIENAILSEAREQTIFQEGIQKLPSHPTTSEAGREGPKKEILTFALQERSVVEYHSQLVSPRRRVEALGGSRWPKSPGAQKADEDALVAAGSSPLRSRGILGTSQPFASTAAAEAARYHVDVGVNRDELDEISPAHFDDLLRQGRHEAQRQSWAFRTSGSRAIRLTLESL